MSAPPPSRPLRIACLHGYRQNAQRFRRKTGALRKALEHPSAHPLAELVYIDAPFLIEPALAPDDLPDPPRPERVVFAPKITAEPATTPTLPANRSNKIPDLTQRTWWEVEGRIYAGWDKSCEYLRAQFAEKRFDGILGFSQGAVAASLICATHARSPSAVPEFASLRFAILLSGFPSRADAHRPLYAAPIPLPSLHVWGLNDAVIPSDASRSLRDKFAPQHTAALEHPHGHLVPSDAHSRRAVADFVRRFVVRTEAPALPDDADHHLAEDGPRAAL